MKVRKKPVEVEARQWDGTAEGATGIIDWALSHGTTITYTCDLTYEGRCPKHPCDHYLVIGTLEGDMIARSGYWVIKGVEDEFWGVAPLIFQRTYEESTIAVMRVGRVMIEHRPYPTGSPYCSCGWRPQWFLNDTMADRGQHMGHVADMILAAYS